jgi:membrane protein implicated in regulation of membrane protease activity
LATGSEASESIGRLGRWYASAASSLRVRSALNPMLWLCALVPTAAFLGAVITGNPMLAGALVSIGALPVVCAVWGFVYFAVKAPHRLQSEEYQLRHEMLRVVSEQKGRRVRIDIATLDAITNPSKALPTTEGSGP